MTGYQYFCRFKNDVKNVYYMCLCKMMSKKIKKNQRILTRHKTQTGYKNNLLLYARQVTSPTEILLLHFEN